VSRIDPRDVRRAAKEAAAQASEDEDQLADALLAEVEQPGEK
jgi:uncharacterized protein (UPF0147 family)